MLGDTGCYPLNDFKHIGCADGGIAAKRHHLENLLCPLLGEIPGILPQKIRPQDFNAY